VIEDLLECELNLERVSPHVEAIDKGGRQTGSLADRSCLR
jgi:hypothetical protein